MGASQKAYFHSGKNYLVFEKGAQALGEWRLSNIEKEFATFTHHLGKSLALKRHPKANEGYRKLHPEILKTFLDLVGCFDALVDQQCGWKFILTKSFSKLY
ncbi:hypothetical protein [Polynucleobacter necessarius]|uniref:hypothetical protein n=1 Tax=Polynucleobacter necessarius TaxID=576610 RepID=UPI001E57F79C|nr:hypothetical protein [Polynucleobacter necessarius]